MAPQIRRALHPLIRGLLGGEGRVSFFQAVRLIQALYPEAPRVGEQGPVSDEVLRFTGTLSLSFPTQDITAFEQVERPDATQDRYRLALSFLGLYGVGSPLASSYTEDLLAQEQDSLERGFFDLFQHRLHSLFYRAWERYRYSVRFRPDGKDYYSRRLSALLHVQADQVPRNHALPRLRLLALSGLLSQEPRSASSLEAALRTLLPQLAVRIEPFVARPVPIPPAQQLRLGTSTVKLAEDAYLGDAVRDCSLTFRVVLEAADFAGYVQLLPGGQLLAPVRELLDLFNTDLLDYQLEVRLAEGAVPEPRLGSPSTLLGWSTWLGPPAPADRNVRILCEGAFHGGR